VLLEEVLAASLKMDLQAAPVSGDYISNYTLQMTLETMSCCIQAAQATLMVNMINMMFLK
jgi:hypothetical protein